MGETQRPLFLREQDLKWAARADDLMAAVREVNAMTDVKIAAMIREDRKYGEEFQSALLTDDSPRRKAVITAAREEIKKLLFYSNCAQREMNEGR